MKPAPATIVQLSNDILKRASRSFSQHEMSKSELDKVIELTAALTEIAKKVEKRVNGEERKRA